MGAVVKFPYDVKVAACADYLLGVSTDEIFARHGVSDSLVAQWIRARGCFKLRADYHRFDRLPSIQSLLEAAQ